MTAHPTSENLAQAQPLEALSAPLTAGQLLRAARLKAGVHLAVLSVTLKVPVKQLEALELDEFDPAKGPVFFRGLASAVCRHLQTDPAPILALLPQAPGHLAPQRTVGAAGSVVQVMGAMRSSSSKSRKPVLWGAVAMLALIAALLWLPAPSQWLWLDDLSSWFQSESQNDEVAGQDAANSAMTGPNGGDSPNAQAAGEAVAVPMPVSMVAETTPASAAAASSPLSTPVPALMPPAAQPSLGTALPPRQDLSSTVSKTNSAEWLFSAELDSWIELRHGLNTVVWSGLVKAGQSQRVQSPLPVRVVVGRAQGVTVTLRGQPFDLKPHTQVTVARFEVKE